MINRILFLLVVLLLVVPSGAMANDGGPELDTERYLIIIATPISEKVEIGGEFEFKLELINNSSDKIFLYCIERIFEGDDLGYYYGIDFFQSTDDEILAEEKMTLTLKTKVPNNVYWYKQAGKFFLNFDIKINYQVFEFIEELNEDPEPYYGHDSKQLPVYPIEITNINDGTNLVSVSIKNKAKKLFYIENYESLADYYTEYKSEITIDNLSSLAIDNLYIKTSGNSFFAFENIVPSATLSEYLYTNYYLSESELHDTMSYEYNLLFTINNEYYAVSYEKEYPVMKISYPRLDLKLVTYNNIKYLEFTNNSDIEFKNLYFFLGDNNLIETVNFQNSQSISLKNGESYKLELNDDNPDKNHIFLGTLYDDKVYIWRVSEYNDYNSFNFVYYKSFNLKKALITPTLTPKLTATPKPTKVPTSTPPPSPTIAPTEAPTPTLSPTDEPMIEVVDVKKSSSIPFWVWYVLAVAIICAFVLIVLFRKNASDDKLKYE